MGYVIGVIAAILALCFGVPPILSAVDESECRYAATNASVETKFVQNHIWSWQCYVSVDGKWIPIDKWRGDSDD